MRSFLPSRRFLKDRRLPEGKGGPFGAPSALSVYIVLLRKGMSQWFGMGPLDTPANGQPTIGRPFYGQAKGQLRLTWRSYAGLPHSEESWHMEQVVSMVVNARGGGDFSTPRCCSRNDSGGRQRRCHSFPLGMPVSCLPLCHLERRYMSVWEVVCRDSIETQSREISGRNASYTIEAWDFSTSLRCGRNDRKVPIKNTTRKPGIQSAQ